MWENKKGGWEILGRALSAGVAGALGGVQASAMSQGFASLLRSGVGGLIVSTTTIEREVEIARKAAMYAAIPTIAARTAQDILDGRRDFSTGRLVLNVIGSLLGAYAGGRSAARAEAMRGYENV